MQLLRGTVRKPASAEWCQFDLDKPQWGEPDRMCYCLGRFRLLHTLAAICATLPLIVALNLLSTLVVTCVLKYFNLLIVELAYSLIDIHSTATFRRPQLHKCGQRDGYVR